MKELVLIGLSGGGSALATGAVAKFFVEKWIHDVENSVADVWKNFGGKLSELKTDLKEIEVKLHSLELEVKAENKGALAVLTLQVADSQKRFGDLEKVKQDLNVLFERVRAASSLSATDKS